MKHTPIKLMSLVLLALLTLTSAGAHAQDDVTVTASVRTNRVYMGDELLIEVLVEGVDSVREPEVEPISGASLRFLGGSNVSRSFTMIVNGKRTENSTKGYTLQYALTPTRPGRIVAPSIGVEVNGRVYPTDPIVIEAIEPQSDDEFALELAIDTDQVYVGQPVRARVTWFIAAAINEFSFRASPEPEGFDVLVHGGSQRNARTIEFDVFGQRVSATQSRASRDGVDYPVLTFDMTLIPRRVGRQSIGPLNVVFNRRDDRRVQRRQALSNEVVLDVLPLPSEGRPQNFTGLVGVYTIDAEASPTSVAVGDPIELSVEISGPEPLGGVDAPDLSLEPGFAEMFKPSTEGWRRQPTTRSGMRRFTTTIRARSDEITEIPPIRLPYFDARRGEYRDALSEAIPLEVRPVRRVTAADAITGPRRASPSLSRALERAPEGMWAIETDPDRLLRADGFELSEVVRSPGVITLVAAPPALYAGVVVVGAVRSRRDPVARRRRRALSRARRTVRARGAPEGVRTLVGGLLNRPEQSVTGQDCLELTPSEDARTLARVLVDAEAGRFGDDPAPGEDRGDTLGAMRRVWRASMKGGAS